MSQSRISTFLFALASLTGILCASATEGQVYSSPLGTPRLQSFPIPSSDSQPISITRGPDGNFWFTEQNRSQVARITPQGVITEFLTPTFSFPIGITPGPDGNIWFREGAVGQIAFITPGGHIEEILFSSSGAAGGIVTGPDGNIWFADLIGNMIWRLELPSRSLTSFPIPTENSFPNDIMVGADGNLWFTEGSGGKIGRITTSGVITEFGSGLTLPFSITNGRTATSGSPSVSLSKLAKSPRPASLPSIPSPARRSRSRVVTAITFCLPSSAAIRWRRSSRMASSLSPQKSPTVVPRGSSPGRFGRFGFWVTRLIESTELLFRPSAVE
jgi:hypothetical protein